MFLMKNKSQTKSLLQSFFNLVQTQINTSIEQIQTDNGIEFQMSKCYNRECVIHQKIWVERLKKNGVIERKH